MSEFLASDDLIDESPQPELRRGSRLGRYELLVPIAKGGMARVWAARLQGQRGFSKMVAVKTILPHLAEEPEFERMFLDEARIAAGVHHPNVCEIYELGEEGKILYLAMEWVNGESLVTVLRGGLPATPGSQAPQRIEPIHPHLAARIISDAASGLHAAHNLTDDDGHPLGVVHRDVSPHNILISADGNVKVADFGVAKAMGQMTATAAGQIKGKMAYMSPEQVAGGKVDRRSDVFSLGVVLYEATTGCKPFEGDGDAQVMHAILSGTFVPPSKLMRGFPIELEQIILRAFAHEAVHRYATAERLHLALEGFIAKSGSVVTPSHIASVVQSRVGSILERRKEKIRAAIQAPAADDISASGAHSVGVGTSAEARSGSGVVDAPRPQSFSDGTGRGIFENGAPVTGSGTAPAARAAAVPGAGFPYMKVLLAVSVGVALACGIAVAGVWGFNRAKVEPALTSGLKPAVVAVTAAPVAVTSAAPTPPSSASPPISFVVNVPEAMLIVDGVAKDAPVRAVDRPKAGMKVSVSVQAPGHGDHSFVLDENSPSQIVVNLPVLAAANPTFAAPATSAGASWGRAPIPSLPSNPFGPTVQPAPPVVVALPKPAPPPVVVALPQPPPPKSAPVNKPGALPANPF